MVFDNKLIIFFLDLDDQINCDQETQFFDFFLKLPSYYHLFVNHSPPVVLRPTNVFKSVVNPPLHSCQGSNDNASRQ